MRKNLFPGVINFKTGENDQVKYSQILERFTAPFEDDFPEEFDMDDIFQLSINAWNMGNMSINIPEEEFDQLLADNPFPEPVGSTLARMINRKKSDYRDFDRFIADFRLDEEPEGLRLTVITQDKDDYLKDLEQSMVDDPFTGDDFEEGFLRRQALIIKPRQPFLDWLHSLDAGEPGESTIYLISEEIDDVDAWLKKKFDRFFIMELEDWCENKKQWPRKRSFKMFNQWFKVETSSLIYDLEKEPVHKGW